MEFELEAAQFEGSLCSSACTLSLMSDKVLFTGPSLALPTMQGTVGYLAVDRILMRRLIF